MKNRNIILLVLVIILIAFLGHFFVGFGQFISLHNNEIDQKMRNEIHKLNEKIIKISKNNY